MNTIEEKIEKGKKIAEIVEDIKQLESISDILNDYINVKIYKNNGINILNNSKIFSKIVWKHIDEIRVDVTKAIDSLKEELSSIVK